MVPLDIQSHDSVQRCVEAVIGRAGRIDVLVNNAGFDLYGALEETSWEEFEEQIDTNFMGAVRMVKAVLPRMREQGGGRIVNIGSLGGRLGLPMNSAYAASKFALEGFSESLRLEMLPHKVYVSVIVPGAVATDTLATSIREVSASVSAYVARREAMVHQMRDEGVKSRVKPADVADAVERLVASEVPPLTCTVGGQAKWIPRMKAALPQRTFERLMCRLFP
jgi:NAD(P)-dependent dehydrogenase (short-subunit alcohol dehydrogenase family)